jgi:FkbM family methyltransferase
VSLTGLLKKVLFRDSIKHPRAQRAWSQLHTISIFGMNYGGGAFIETSGETWVLTHAASHELRDIKTPVVFDVGANTGHYALLVKQLIPNAIVYAFEPSKTTFQELTRNVGQLAEANPIKPYNIGFSDSARIIELYSYTVEGHEESQLSSIDLRQPTQVLDVQTKSSEQIEVRTLDDFCAAEGITRIDFLKLDVEGHEVSVLRGARQLLESGAVSIIQFEFGPANIYSRTFFYDFWSLLSPLYDLFRIIPTGIVPLTYYGEHREIFLTTNYLALKKGLSKR